MVVQGEAEVDVEETGAGVVRGADRERGVGRGGRLDRGMDGGRGKGRVHGEVGGKGCCDSVEAGDTEDTEFCSSTLVSASIHAVCSA